MRNILLEEATVIEEEAVELFSLLKRETSSTHIEALWVVMKNIT